MKKTYNKLTCLFGHHDYSEEETKDKNGHPAHLCKICKRSGYRKWDDEVETRYDYDKEGNLVHEKWSDGGEWWWLDNGCWTSKKPKNWEER